MAYNKAKAFSPLPSDESNMTKNEHFGMRILTNLKNLTRSELAVQQEDASMYLHVTNWNAAHFFPGLKNLVRPLVVKTYKNMRRSVSFTAPLITSREGEPDPPAALPVMCTVLWAFCFFLQSSSIIPAQRTTILLDF